MPKTSIVCISDTHNQHEKLNIPECDIIIHSGDFSSRGGQQETLNFLSWFGKLDQAKHKILICGNHDYVGENFPQFLIDHCTLNDINYLNDSGINLCGFQIWGSPIQPEFMSWAFNRKRGEDIKKHWDLIPENTDILITHGPPYKILDKVNNNWQDDPYQGCKDLKDAIDRVEPKLHVFGHIHEGSGMYVEGKTVFINASVLNERYNYVNPPQKLLFEDGHFNGVSLNGK